MIPSLAQIRRSAPNSLLPCSDSGWLVSGFMTQACRIKSVLLVVLTICTAAGMADQTLAQASDAAQVRDGGQVQDGALVQGRHQHQPMYVQSRPVIERLPVKVVAPVDVAFTTRGQALIADSVGESIFRVDRDGTVDLLAGELSGLSRIVADESGNVFAVLNSAGAGPAGSARIVQITAQGFVSEQAHLPFKASGLAADLIGNIYTANGATGEVVMLDNEGTQQVLARVSGPVSDLALDSAGNVIVLMSNGKVVSVAVDSSTRTVGYTAAGASRLSIHPDGSVIALHNANEATSTSLVTVEPTVDSFSSFASVPRGTSAFDFDHLGNLVLGNDRLRAVTKVTSRVQVPCPHGGQSTLMFF
jgi:hypothetical protein